MRTVSYPVVGRRAEGVRFWDVDGNEYVDFAMGYGVHLFGFAPPFLMEAVRRESESGAPIGPLSHHSVEVAEKLVSLTGNQRVAFCNTGTEDFQS